jgi:glycosyltransferase involved in cell wall biosynthesis
MRLIDRFLTSAELDRLFDECDYAFLPYGPFYTGGAGPLKDAFAYGKPVVCSRLPIFEEIVLKHRVGLIVDGSEPLAAVLAGITDEEYQAMSDRCRAYAGTHSWRHMREQYYLIYARMQRGRC